MSYKKIVFILFLFFTKENTQAAAKENSRCIFVEQGEIKTNDKSSYDLTFKTDGLSPCFCFVVFEKRLNILLAMANFGPDGSTASKEAAGLYIFKRLREMLAQVQTKFFKTFPPALFFDQIKIFVCGGQNPDSTNTIEAIKDEIVLDTGFLPLRSFYEQKLPIVKQSFYFLGLARSDSIPGQEEESLRVSSYRQPDNPSLNIKIGRYLQRDEDNITYEMTYIFMDLCFSGLSDWQHQKYLQQQFKALSS